MNLERHIEVASIPTRPPSYPKQWRPGTAPPFLVSPPELVAVVSTGTGYVPAFSAVEKVVGAVSQADEQWFGELPAIPGRYGAYHNEDNYGIGRESLVDF